MTMMYFTLNNFINIYINNKLTTPGGPFCPDGP
jgi:hypothetical protein